MWEFWISEISNQRVRNDNVKSNLIDPETGFGVGKGIITFWIRLELKVIF